MFWLTMERMNAEINGFYMLLSIYKYLHLNMFLFHVLYVAIIFIK